MVLADERLVHAREARELLNRVALVALVQDGRRDLAFPVAELVALRRLGHELVVRGDRLVPLARVEVEVGQGLEHVERLIAVVRVAREDVERALGRADARVRHHELATGLTNEVRRVGRFRMLPTEVDHAQRRFRASRGSPGGCTWSTRSCRARSRRWNSARAGTR